MSKPEELPLLRNDGLIWIDTARAPTPNGIVPCLLCTKPFVMPVFIGEPDQICPECHVTYKDSARVICKKCGITIGRVVSKILENGYYVRPRSVLHSNSCNICQPGLNESTIIEIDQWQRHIRQSKVIVPMRR